MAEFLASHYDREIADTTPYWWWKMDKASKLPEKMPEPVQQHGQSPFFDPDEIREWYGRYLLAIDEPYPAEPVKSELRQQLEKSRRSTSQPRLK